MKLIHFFALIGKRRFFEVFNEGDFSDIEFVSPNDFEAEIDSKRLPEQRFYNQIEVKEVHADYRKFKALKYFPNRIIVFPRHQLHNCEIVNGILSSSITISVMKKRDIKNIREKHKNFVMAEIKTLIPEGKLIWVDWHLLQKNSSVLFYEEKNNYANQEILIEKLGPIPKSGRDKILDSNYLVRYFLPDDWRKIISQDLSFYQAKLFRPEEIGNNPWLKANCLPVSLSAINSKKQKILTA